MQVEFIRDFIGHTSSIYTICEGKNLNEFFSSGSDRQIVNWKLESENGELIALCDDTVFSLEYSKNHNILFCGTEKGYLYRIDLNKNNQTRKFVFHQKSIYKMIVHDQSLFCIGGDGILSEVDIITFKLMSAHKIYSRILRSMVYSETLRSFIIGAQDGIVFQFNLQTKNVNKIIQIESKKTIFSLLINNSRLVVGSMDARLRVISLEIFEEIISPIQAHWYTINDLIWVDEKKIIISASRDKTLRIWNDQDFTLQKEISLSNFKAHTRSINKILWLSETNILLSASEDRLIKSWSIN